MLPCPIKKMTGYDCLGCGTQRSLLHMIELDFKKSLELYPPLIIGICLTILFLLTNLFLKKKLKTNWLVASLLFVVIINFLIKTVY